MKNLVNNKKKNYKMNIENKFFIVNVYRYQ